jgi:hypothetical protein
MNTILIYWDDPKAKDLAQQFRDMKHRAQLRNPRLFDGVCEKADIVCVESAAKAPHVVEAYQAKGVEVRDLSVVLGEIVAAEEAEAKASQPQAAPKPAATTPPKPVAAAAPAITPPNTSDSRFDAMTDDELRAYVNEAGKEIGVSAHPRASRPKLLAQAKLLGEKAS